MRGCLGLLVLLASSAPAWSEPDGNADALFKKAKAAMAAGKTAEACALFDQSQQLDPSVSTLLNQANCREKNGQLGTAWELFDQARTQTSSSTDPNEKKLKQVATDRIAQLEPRLSRLTLHLAAGAKIAGLAITRNDTPVSADSWERPIPVDGGDYTITATAPGRKPATQKVHVDPERDAKVIDIPVLERESIKPTPTPTPANPTQPQQPDTGAPEEPDEQFSSGGSKTMPIVVGVAGVAMLGGAVGFELWGRSLLSDAKVEANDARQNALYDSANTKHYVAQGLLVGGVAATGVAIWLFVRAGKHEESHGMALNPIVTNDQAGIQVRGWW